VAELADAQVSEACG